MLKILRLFALLPIALAMPELARAHAVLVASTPKINGVVHGGSLHVNLQFNSRVDGPHCTLSLVSPDGQAHFLTLAVQPAPAQIASEADGLKSGSYILRWQALAADGHITRGAIPFRVE